MSVKRNIKYKIDLGYISDVQTGLFKEYCREAFGPIGKKSGWWHSKPSATAKFYLSRKIARRSVFTFKYREDALAFQLKFR